MKLKLPSLKSNKIHQRMPSVGVYVSQGGALIVAPRHNNFAGIPYEQDHPIVLTVESDHAALGAALLDAFKRYSIVDRNLRDDKPNDWPAYRVSGCKSKAAFERDFARINVRQIDQTGRRAVASANPPGAENIWMEISILLTADPSEIGQRLRRLARISQNLYDRMEDLLD